MPTDKVTRKQRRGLDASEVCIKKQETVKFKNFAYDLREARQNNERKDPRQRPLPLGTKGKSLLLKKNPREIVRT